MRAGFAIIEEEHCTIEISNTILTGGNRSFLKPVLWHELGHCAGLPHDSKSGELMFSTTSVTPDYGADVIGRFISSFLLAAGL